jgi:hypothetical protein
MITGFCKKQSLGFLVIRSSPKKTGEVPEWLNGTVSKTVVGLVPTVGSNPTLSAARKLDKPFSNWRGVFLVILSVVV